MKRQVTAAFACLFLMGAAHSVELTEWIERCDRIGKLPSVAAEDSLRFECKAIVAVSMYDTAVAIKGGFTPYYYSGPRVPDAEVDIAVAAAAQAALLKLFPAQKQQILEMLDASNARPGPQAKAIQLGRRIAEDLVKRRNDLNIDLRNDYRPVTEQGVWTSTEMPMGIHHGAIHLWAIPNLETFMPPLPPKLSSDIWTKDYIEVKEVGALESTKRTAEQTAAAEFWNSDYSYDSVLRQAITQAGRSLLQNVRFLAIYYVTNHDTFAIGFAAKYRYLFWRPITAIRNGDRDGNPLTERDQYWEPLAPTPAHPEYTCGHCREGATIKEVLTAEFGTSLKEPFTVVSAQKPARTFTSFDDVSREESASRVWLGVHYTHTTKVTHDFVQSAAEFIRTRFFRPATAKP